MTIEKRHHILAETSGGKYTAEDVYNLEKYGVKHPRDIAPSPEDELPEGVCVCGVYNCPDGYAHTTSGY